MKLLFLTPVLPWPHEIRGGAQRTSLLLEALQESASVDVAYVGLSSQGTALAEQARASGLALTAALTVGAGRRSSQEGIISLVPFASRIARAVNDFTSPYRADPELEHWLRNLVRERKYDCVVSRYLWPSIATGLENLDSVVKVLDWDDLDHLKFQSSVRAVPWPGAGGWLGSRIVYSRIRSSGLRAASRFDHVWVAKPTDAVGLPCKSVSVLPNIPFVPERSGATDVHVDPQRPYLFFVGDLTYRPNIDGFDRFVHQIWPAIRAAVPESTVVAVGIPPTAGIRQAWSAVEGIEIRGVVADLLPYYSSAALSVCPVEWGGGTNIKAVESLFFGVPVVVFPHTFEGYRQHFGPGSGMYCGTTNEEFANACIELLRNPARRDAAGLTGQAIVRAEYSVASFRSIVRSGLESATAPARSN